MKCEVRTVKYEVRNMNYEVLSLNCEVWRVNFELALSIDYNASKKRIKLLTVKYKV